jgi:hypothetical protein
MAIITKGIASDAARRDRPLPEAPAARASLDLTNADEPSGAVALSDDDSTPSDDDSDDDSTVP